MKVEPVQDVVDEIGPSAILVYAIEGPAPSLDRQRRDVEGFGVGRNCGDARSDTKAGVADAT